MKIIKNTSEIKYSRVLTLLTLVSLIFLNNQSFAQDRSKKLFLMEVEIKLLSGEIIKFDKPICRGAGERAIEYHEALVLKILANSEQLDLLPPNIAPFLYIGKEEYRIFDTERYKDSDKRVIIFHVRNWEKLEDNVPIVLTINHGDPIRNPEKYNRNNVPRFDKKIIIDKR